MTFLEAAIEILRSADGPLHFSEVAKRAVERNLLSHVGRDPEAAMRSCLNSAVRGGHDGGESVIIRDKPGFYAVREGADLPARSEPENASHSASKSAKVKARSKVATSEVEKREPEADEDEPDDDDDGDGDRDAASDDGEPTAAPEPTRAPARRVARGGAQVEFVAPEGSGLEGVTDVALVMANAMSRLVEERPELRHELDAMQQVQPPPPPQVHDSTPSRERPQTREHGRGVREVQVEERGGRRRRRRRRRGKRVDWAGGNEGARGSAQTVADRLLDEVAAALEQAGGRSLHVRQIAETLAGKGLLGGEVSEIERAVTAAVLLDIRAGGRMSRFVARGDARYQLQGGRVPERVARAEQGLRDAARTLDDETRAQLLVWLQSLGTRGLEAVARIWLRREGLTLVSALPPARGVGRLVVEDPEAEDEEGRALVIVVPRRTGFDPKLWEGEAERQGCSSQMLVCTADVPDDYAPPSAPAPGGESRVIGAAELAGWLREQKIAVDRIALEVSVLDPTFIESIAGLDT
jgi:hypothetical protein